MRNARSIWLVTAALGLAVFGATFGLGLAACSGGKKNPDAGGGGAAGAAGEGGTGAGGATGGGGATGAAGTGGATGAAGRGGTTGSAGRGGATGSAGAGGAAGGCSSNMTITVSGAFTGTRSVTSVTTNWSSTNDTSQVSESAQSGTPFQVLLNITFPGMPSAGTYTQATSGLTCLITVTDSADATRAWLASTGAGGPDIGACSLTLTSVTPTATSATQMQYCVHGSITAMLPAISGGAATGTVTLATSF